MFSEKRTDSGSDVARAEGLDGKVWVDFADDLGGIAVGEVRVLQRMSVNDDQHLLSVFVCMCKE